VSDVAHGVPVLSPHGGRVGTAIVADGHVEIVWDDKQMGKELMERILIGHCTSLVLYGTGDPAVPAQ
jgi:hypothetical protein